ncbi:hypothetical protein KUTeg_020826 [Tegillarca granosa]|uniref:CUB domain-containing protein n=1 Tax=Tegillarca granosa TaxID=220873 RepID=A0ABQ9E927_TEGGR|nr:hypothetical protein KUTeg_020826 [Tegillarca granosa]
MCIGFHWSIITIVLIGILTCSRRVEGGTITIDLEKNFCESKQTVTDNDVYRIIANPRSDLPSGRDHCNVFFTADPPIRKFYLYIKKVQIADCGVSLKIYDGDPAIKNHRWSLSCQGPPERKLLTWYGNIVVRLEKYTSESSNIYDIDVLLTTDQGPLIDTGTDVNMEGLSTGAIVGIAVGAGTAVIFIVGFILFCICRMYGNDKEDKKYPSTVFSTATSGTGPQVNGILKRSENKNNSGGEGGSVRGQKKSYDNPAYRRSLSDDLESGSNFSDMPSGSEQDGYSRVDEYAGADRSRRGGDIARESYFDERKEKIVESIGKRGGMERGSGRQSRRDSMRKANRYRGDTVDGRNPAYRSDRDRNADSRDTGHSNPAYRDESPEKQVKAISLSNIGSLNPGRDRNRRNRENESESSSVTPSRATDDSRGSSSITDGTYEHKYRPRDDSMRRSRSRSSSRSSARGRRERSERATHQQHLNHQPGQRRHSHRSRRKKEKEPSPYIDIWKDAKKKPK